MIATQVAMKGYNVNLSNLVLEAKIRLHMPRNVLKILFNDTPVAECAQWPDFGLSIPFSTKRSRWLVLGLEQRMYKMSLE